MASDSRLTLTTTQVDQQKATTIQLSVGQSDANYKTFLAPNQIGISTFGAAAVQGEPVAGTIEAFIREQLTHPQREVDEVPGLLLDYFRQRQTSLDTQFHIGGYKTIDGQRHQQVWQVAVRSGSIQHINEGYLFGATWGGEGDVLARLVQPVSVREPDGKLRELPSYTIPWQFFTLQDGIDFVVYAVRTTIDSIRFQPRPKSVGGPIDVLVIKPDDAFWVQRKQLRIS